MPLWDPDRTLKGELEIRILLHAVVCLLLNAITQQERHILGIVLHRLSEALEEFLGRACDRDPIRNVLGRLLSPVRQHSSRLIRRRVVSSQNATIGVRHGNDTPSVILFDVMPSWSTLIEKQIVQGIRSFPVLYAFLDQVMHAWPDIAPGVSGRCAEYTRMVNGLGVMLIADEKIQVESRTESTESAFPFQR